VEAIYRTEVDELVIPAEKAVANLDPWSAVEAFLHAFVRYAEGKRILLSELREAFDKRPDLKLRSRERIDQAMNLVITRAQQAGAVRTDIDGADVVQLITPMCTNSTLVPDQTERLLVMILDGLRPPARPR
jgi:hypothetical protein